MIVAQVFGIEQGALVLALRAVLWCAVAVAAWRVAGERGEVLRDLLMHPRARAELDVLTALHLLLHGPLIAWLLDALHAYALIWLWGFALGPRAFRTGSERARRSCATARCTASRFR